MKKKTGAYIDWLLSPMVNKQENDVKWLKYYLKQVFSNLSLNSW